MQRAYRDFDVSRPRVDMLNLDDVSYHGLSLSLSLSLSLLFRIRRPGIRLPLKDFYRALTWDGVEPMLPSAPIIDSSTG
jgi:hypothetical protein